MIDLASNLESIEKLMSLMDQYKIDEVSVDFVCIKKVKHSFPIPKLTEEQILAKHLAPLPQEPWESIPDSALNSFSVSGKL